MKKAISVTMGLALVLVTMSLAAPAAFANSCQAVISATNSGTNTGVGGLAGLASTGVNAPVTTAAGSGIATNSGTNTAVGGVAGGASTGVNAPVTTAVGGTAGFISQCNGGHGENGGLAGNGGAGGAGGIGGAVVNSESGGSVGVAASVAGGNGVGNLASTGASAAGGAGAAGGSAAGGAGGGISVCNSGTCS